MAYTKIINIKNFGHLTDTINYAANLAKTLETLTVYAGNEEKTMDGARYVSAINCCPETAAKAMVTTKKRFGKVDGRVAYHIIQSFLPGEVTPELAHKIGKQYAERWLGDYEVVIGTHLDHKHLHNHIIVNSVSCVTGNKFHISRGDFYRKLRGISDEICRENGLSVIEYVDGKNMTYEEYLRRHSGGRTLRGIVIDDIETCIGKSFSLEEFYMRLEDLGYEVDTSVMHPKVKAPDARKAMRLEGLGYSTDELTARIYHQERKRAPQAVRKFYVKKRFPHRKLTSIEALYIYYLYLLGKIRQHPRESHIPVSEYRKFYFYKRQFEFVAQNGFSKISEVVSTLEQTNAQLKKMQAEKYRLRGAQKKFKPLFEAHSVYERYSAIPDKLDEERKVMLKNAKEVLKKSGYADNLSAIKEMRMEILGAVTQNREEISRLKKTKRGLEEVIKCAKEMKSNLLDAEQQKQQDNAADEPDR